MSEIATTLKGLGIDPQSTDPLVGRLSEAFQKFPPDASTNGRITDERAQNLLTVANLALDISKGHPNPRLTFLAQSCLNNVYRRTDPDSAHRIAAFDTIMQRYDELVYVDQEGWKKHLAPFSELLKLAAFSGDLEGNQLRREEIERASERVWSYLKESPADPEKCLSLQSFACSELVPPHYKEPAVLFSIENAKLSENPYDAYLSIFNYEVAHGTLYSAGFLLNNKQQIIDAYWVSIDAKTQAGTLTDDDVLKAPRFSPADLNSRGRELNSLIIEALLTFAAKLEKKEDKVKAYTRAIEMDHDERRIAQIKKQLVAIAPKQYLINQHKH
jgi:hypothetical protein